MRAICSVLAFVLVLSAHRAAAQSDPYTGTFSNGVLTLQLQGGNGAYQGTAMLQGQQFPVTARQSMNGLEGTYTAQGTAYPWTAALQGDLLIMYVDGQTLQLQRQVAGSQQPRQPGPQPGAGAQGSGQQQLSAAGREWYDYFVGKRLTRMDSYSSYDASGAGGGYSAREEWDLCSNGRFFYSGSSSVSAGAGGVSGYSGGSDGGAGQWRIIEEGGLVGIELRWNDGNVIQARLEYSEGGTYANGERIYVTPDNTSCR